MLETRDERKVSADQSLQYSAPPADKKSESECQRNTSNEIICSNAKNICNSGENYLPVSPADTDIPSLVTNVYLNSQDHCDKNIPQCIIEITAASSATADLDEDDLTETEDASDNDNDSVRSEVMPSLVSCQDYVVCVGEDILVPGDEAAEEQHEINNDISDEERQEDNDKAVNKINTEANEKEIVVSVVDELNRDHETPQNMDQSRGTSAPPSLTLDKDTQGSPNKDEPSNVANDTETLFDKVLRHDFNTDRSQNFRRCRTLTPGKTLLKVRAILNISRKLLNVLGANRDVDEMRCLNSCY